MGSYYSKDAKCPYYQYDDPASRAMSDEELATFIDEFWSSPWCPDEPPINTDTLECLMHDDDCKLCILDWLRQEVSE